MAQRLASIEIDLQNGEVQGRSYLRQIQNLKSQLDRQTRSHAQAAQVEEIFHYWQQVCKHPRAKLGVKRRRAIGDRLDDGYTVEDLKGACDGAALDAYVNTKGQRFDDIDLICRDEVKLESFIRRGARPAERESKPDPRVQLVKVLELVSNGLSEGQHGAIRSKCPACRSHWDDYIYRPVVINEYGIRCESCGADEQRIREALIHQTDDGLYEEAA